jgi:hypothetical protein
MILRLIQTIFDFYDFSIFEIHFVKLVYLSSTSKSHGWVFQRDSKSSTKKTIMQHREWCLGYLKYTSDDSLCSNNGLIVLIKMNQVTAHHMVSCVVMWVSGKMDIIARKLVSAIIGLCDSVVSCCALIG